MLTQMKFVFFVLFSIWRISNDLDGGIPLSVLMPHLALLYAMPRRCIPIQLAHFSWDDHRPWTLDLNTIISQTKKQNMSKWITLCEQSIERITHIELVPMVALALTCAIASVFFFSFTFLNTDTEASHLRLFFVFWSECNNIEMRHAANNNRIEMVLESKCSVETNAAAFYTIDRNAQWELINYAPFFRMVNWIWRRMCRVCITIIQNVHCSM